MVNAQVDIVKKGPETFQVTVRAKSMSVHSVTLSHHYYQRLASGKVTPEKLIEKSFEFLMERESNMSIHSRFDLSTISRYFPEYEESIVKRL